MECQAAETFTVPGLPRTWLLLLTSVVIAKAQERWVTVLAMDVDNGNANPYHLLMGDGALNDAPDKELTSPEVLTAGGNFKSSMADQWTTYSPEKVRLILYDKYGYILWFALFSPAHQGKDPNNWFLASSLNQSTDTKLTVVDDCFPKFDTTTLEIRWRGSGDLRLQVTYDPPLILFPEPYFTDTTDPLDVPEFKSNTDMVLEQASPTASAHFPFAKGSTLWISFAFTNYYAGFGLKRNLTAPGQINKLIMHLCMDPRCDVYTPYYQPGTTVPKVFTADYKLGEDKTLAVFWFDRTMAAYCVELEVTERTAYIHNTGVYLYSTQYDIMEAQILAIQWWLDPLRSTTTTEATQQSTCRVLTVCEDTSTEMSTTQDLPSVELNETMVEKLKEEIQQTLTVPKEETSSYKRQFVSAPDPRWSSQVIGAVGISVISVIILGVIVLDFATIAVQLRIARSNLKHLFARKHRGHGGQRGQVQGQGHGSDTSTLQLQDISYIDHA